VTINGQQEEVIADTTVESITIAVAAYSTANDPDQCLDTENLCVCSTYAGEPVEAAP
jgi:hypothetical protein